MSPDLELLSKRTAPVQGAMRTPGSILTTHLYGTGYPFVQVDFTQERKRLGLPKGDCTVRALALATNTSYAEAAALFMELGDMLMKGVGGAWTERVIHGLHFLERDYHGCTFELRSFPGRKGQPRMSPARFCAEYPEGRWMITTPRHIFAVINGVVYDAFNERPDRCVYKAWRVRLRGEQ